MPIPRLQFNHMSAGRRHLLFFAAVVGGCVHSTPPIAVSNQTPALKWDLKASLPLEDITPDAKLKSPTTRPNGPPSIAALELYARARDATVRGQTQAAINFLQQAIVLDSYRFDLRYDLGWAYVTESNTDDMAIAAFEKAEALEPDSLELETELGRLFLAKSDLPSAVDHLRLATLTSGYAADDGRAAVVDFFLAKALKESGYDRAALERYTLLLGRFEHPSLSLRQNPELAYLLEKPDSLFVEVGELMEKHGEYADAVKAFRPAVDHSPDNFELQSRFARDLALDGQRDAALNKAVELIVRDRATPQSLLVLRDVCRDLNLSDGEVATLRKLSKDRPGDQAVLFALADTLIAKNRTALARQLLQSAWDRSPGDVPLTRRLFSLDMQANAVDAAARMLIHALAVNPDAVHNYSPLWAELLRPGQKDHLKLSALMAMSVPTGDESAKQFWMAETAADDGRMSVERSALEAATRGTPAFAPAFRSLLTMTWIQPDLSGAQKIQFTSELAKAAKDSALAAELRGRSLVNQKKDSQAVVEFTRAVQLGGRSPDLFLAQANASRGIGRDPLYEQMLWKLISDFPLYEDGYTALFAYYANADTGSVEQAMKVLATWLISDPQGLSARISQAQVDVDAGTSREAEGELSRLFSDDPENPDVFRLMRQFYNQAGRANDLIGKLEDARANHPRDTDIVARLVVLYAEQKRNAEAARLLDHTRLIVADDADLLYSLSSLYNEVDQKQTAEDVLQQVIQLDPTHPGACNDLGFAWADEGKNLPLAESLIRTAVAAEPDNESFLDSLGWVLYKRGKFDAAQKYLQQAMGPSPDPDPVVLNHLGDTQYRLAKTEDAKQTWQHSLKDMGDGDVDRADMKLLRLQLLQKIRQAEAKLPVDVSPV